jgi:formate dehydrogenase major subunit
VFSVPPLGRSTRPRAEGFRRNLAKNGRTATGIFSCSKSTNEVNFLASKFARQVFGNNNVDSCNRT